jgi:hypothetical protein
MEPIALGRKGKKKKGKENKDENTDENIKNRPERNDFPRFPTEVDIMLEIVGRNVDLIQTTCTKGKKSNQFLPSSYCMC